MTLSGSAAGHVPGSGSCGPTSGARGQQGARSTRHSPRRALPVAGRRGLPKDRDERIVSKDLAAAREMVRDGIGELLEYARPAACRFAIEPLHPMYAADAPRVNTMAHANDLCDELGSGVG